MRYSPSLINPLEIQGTAICCWLGIWKRYDQRNSERGYSKQQRRENVLMGKQPLFFHHPEENFGVKITQIAHPLCIADAHPHGKNHEILANAKTNTAGQRW